MKKTLLILVIALISCKGKTEKKEEVKQDNKKEAEIVKPQTNSNFTYLLNAKIPSDESMSLYYTEGRNEKFTEKNRLIKKVKGSDDFQEIEFKIMDSKILPSRLRLHFSNKDQKKITIKSVKLMYKDGEFVISDSLFTKYFVPNRFIKYGNVAGEYNFVSIDNTFAPYFVSKTLLADVLDML
jgi:PBP1b-binding outer membrane lipoprotein LpoB